MQWDITDINTSLGCTPKIRRSFDDAQALIGAMDSYRITRAVAFHTSATVDARRGNMLAKQFSDASGGRIGACYVLRPDLGSMEMPSTDELYAQLNREKPAAIKLYPRSNQYILNDFYAGELLEVLSSLRIPVLFDESEHPGHENLPQLAKSYPDIPFVLLRQTINQSRFTRPLLSKLDNVYFDVSIMIDTGLIEEFVRDFGSSRFLFGSGMPAYQPAGSLGLIIYSRIDDTDKAAIFSKNWNALQEAIKWQS